MPHWTKVVICDARDKRGVFHDYAAIREFHRSYKDLKAGITLTEQEATTRITAGETGIARPWKEAGFHWAVACGTTGTPEVIMLRPMTQNGSYARECNFNRSAIGILCEGFSDGFQERLITLCRFLLKTYKLRVEDVIGRWEWNYSKECPVGFSMDGLRAGIQLSLLEGLLHNCPTTV